MLPAASGLLTISFIALAIAIAAGFVSAVYWAEVRGGSTNARAGRMALRAVLGVLVWLGLTGFLAVSGKLSFASRPPTMLFLLLAGFLLALWIGMSRLGARLAVELPLTFLVGFQGFRIIVELLLHRAYEEGLMPVQMSYSGRNFDIIAGITAVVTAGLLAAGMMPRWGVRLWNWLAIALLANILIVAMLSAPLPARVFMNEPANVWITQFPWVWLPSVMVLAAVVGHMLVFRRLRADAQFRSRVHANAR